MMIDLTKPRKKSGFWMTVLKVELADIAFALDSMLAAVALAVTLPELVIFILVALTVDSSLLCY